MPPWPHIAEFGILLGEVIDMAIGGVDGRPRSPNGTPLIGGKLSRNGCRRPSTGDLSGV